MRNEELINTIFDVPVSMFRTGFANECTHITLREWLTSTRHYDQQLKVRATENKAERDELKKKLPAITPSALLKHRMRETSAEEKLISYSGFMQIDIDYKDNAHLPNWSKLMNILSNIENIAYLGESVSGKGYWGLVRISEPEKMNLQFQAFSKLMLKHFGIKLDESKGGNITDLRFYSYTPNAHYNVNAVPFVLKYRPVQKMPTVYTFRSYSFDRCESRIMKQRQFSPGHRNNYLRALAAECNFFGVDLNEAIQCSYKYIDQKYTAERIEKLFKSVYRVINEKNKMFYNATQTTLTT